MQLRLYGGGVITSLLDIEDNFSEVVAENTYIYSRLLWFELCLPKKRY